MTMGVSLQGATAQTPTFDLEQPTASLQRALLVAEDDSQLVDLATALMEARADTKISYEEYRSGVRLFQEHHPGFYGNFLGDPFYATYDVRYQTLAWERQMAEPDINPVNSFRTSDWFFCHPLGYDPAFNGQCRGFTFAVSDFFFLPAGPAFGRKNLASIRDRTQLFATRGDGTVRSRAVSPAPHMPDTSRGLVGDTPTPERPPPERPPSEAVETTAANASPSSARAPRTGLFDHPAPRIDVPDDVHMSMQETASSFKRTETILRIQQAIERRHERGPLSVRERVRAAQQIAADQGMDELTRTMSQAQRTLADPADRRAPVQQLDRNEIEREARRTVNRSSELGTRESTQPRSSVQRRSGEPASSRSRRSRSRSSENSSDNG
jgi:hypothetical protein